MVEYQKQYQAREKLIGIKLEQIARLREMATKTTSVVTQDKIQSSMRNNLEILIIKIIDLEREVNKLIDDNADLKIKAFLNGVRIKGGK